MKVAEFAQLVANSFDWVMPRDAGNGQGDDAGRAGHRAGLAGGGRADEPFHGVAGGDRSEPGAQADMLVQRIQRVQMSLLQRPEQRGDSQHHEQPCPGGLAMADPAGDDAADGQDDDYAGPGQCVLDHAQRRGGAGGPAKRRLGDSLPVAVPAEQYPCDDERDQDRHQTPAAPGRELAVGRYRDDERQGHDDRIEQDCGIRRGVG